MSDTEDTEPSRSDMPATSTPRSSAGSVKSLNSDCFKTLPSDEPTTGKRQFTPTLYSFKISGPSCCGVKNPRVQCPPFHTLLDHTIAVLWNLYLPDESRKELGILHLQWAKCFLESIRDDKGNLSPDIENCLSIISERILQLYDDISSFINPNSFEKLTKDNLSSVNRLSLNSPGTTLNYDSFKENLKSIKDIHSKNDLSRKMHCTEARYPVSITLNEMFSRKPEFMEKIFLEPSEVEASSKSVSAKSTNQDISFDNKTDRSGELGTHSNDCVSKVEMIGYLTTWRKQQVQRIQEEMKRLHEIEELMVIVNKDTEPYIDEKVVKQIYSYDTNTSSSSK